MDSERIILGSGKLYCMVFTGEIPADTAIETDANQLAHIKGGASLEYTAELSREIEHGFYTPEEAYQKLQDIQQMPAKRNLCQILASGVGSGCFCYLFGGDPVDCIVAFIAGLLLYVYLLCVVKGQLSKIATNISGGMFVTFIAVLIYQLGLGHHLSEIIIGSIIPLVPGVAFTNGIRDIADQDYIAGAVRMLDALLVTFSIAMGVGLVMIGYHHFVGGAILP